MSHKSPENLTARFFAFLIVLAIVCGVGYLGCYLAEQMLHVTKIQAFGSFMIISTLIYFVTRAFIYLND